MPEIHPLEAHLLGLLPEGWPVPRGHCLRPARMYTTADEYRAWLTPLLEAGERETVVYTSGREPRSRMRWFCPGVPMLYLGQVEPPARLPLAFRLPVVAALEAGELGLIVSIRPRWRAS